MSSGSLISSLFRDNSFASRSSSMFQKSFSSIDNDPNKNRSQSSFRDKINNSTGNNKYLPVARMVHSLAVKVKKHNYFLFCRLQAILKKSRAENPTPPLKSVQSEIIECSKVTEGSKLTSHTKSIDIQERVAKGLENICEIIQLNQLKQSTKKMEYAYKKIQKFAKRKDAAGKLFKHINAKYSKNINQTFKSLQKFEKFILKAEIFAEACTHVLIPKLKDKIAAIRQYAIQRKIEIQLEQREKQRAIELAKIAKLEKTQHSSVSSSSQNFDRLKSIEQQNSILSEEETARFITPEKGHHFHESIPLKKQSGSKTSRKQTRYPILTRKQTKKQYEAREIEEDQFSYILTSNIKKNNDYQNQDRIKTITYRANTKKQHPKPKIILGKAYNIQTTLQDNKIIKMPKLTKKQQKQSMSKTNRLYTQSIAQPLPDLHDNMGVFQQVWAEQIQDNIFSHRTIQKQKNQCKGVQNQKTVSHSKQNIIDELSRSKTSHQKQYYESKMMQSISFKQNEHPTVTASSRAMSNCKSSPKFVVETGINTSNCITTSLTNLNSINDQFYSSPLYKIEEMMLDLEKLRQKEKFNQKYTTGYQKCKISVNLPSRKSSVCGGKSYQGSANKGNHSGSGKTVGVNECRSDKKDFKKDPLSRYLYKENNQPKENIEVKLWDEKDKFLFYTDSKSKFNKERKRSSCIITSMNQSQINTARKMKKQIEGIINSRKNRTSLGNLKILKSKY